MRRQGTISGPCAGFEVHAVLESFDKYVHVFFVRRTDTIKFWEIPDL
jgi:hypothetical protein